MRMEQVTGGCGYECESETVVARPPQAATCEVLGESRPCCIITVSFLVLESDIATWTWEGVTRPNYPKQR